MLRGRRGRIEMITDLLRTIASKPKGIPKSRAIFLANMSVAMGNPKVALLLKHGLIRMVVKSRKKDGTPHVVELFVEQKGCECLRFYDETRKMLGEYP